MSEATVERIAEALLYEGYLLYPYRPSSVKNRQRFNFGVVFPEAYSRRQSGVEPSEMQTECLVLGDEQTRLGVKARFLQVTVRTRDGSEPPWQEAIEREVEASVHPIGELTGASRSVRFTFPASDVVEDGIRRWRARLDGELVVSAAAVADGVLRVKARITNLSPWSPPENTVREDVLPHSLVSAHTILRVRGGEFVSLLDPPEAMRDLATGCRNVGAWPVLVGGEGSRDTLLSSPIVIYDYPQIAPESSGDLFDATEIDEILSLRILTLTDEEKEEVRRSDERARRLLERTESLAAEQMMKLHGTMRSVRRTEAP